MILTVQTYSHLSITLSLPPATPISTVKSLLCRFICATPADIHLSYNSTHLSDNCIPETYGIQSGAVLRLYVSREILVLALTLESTFQAGFQDSVCAGKIATEILIEGEAYPVKASFVSYIFNVSIPIDSVLAAEGIILNPKEQLAIRVSELDIDVNVGTECVPSHQQTLLEVRNALWNYRDKSLWVLSFGSSLVVLKPGYALIRFKTTENKQFIFPAKRTDSFKDLKISLSEVLQDILIYSNVLIDGRIVNDKETVASCGLKNYYEGEIILPGDAVVNIADLYGETAAFLVSDSQSISDLERKAARMKRNWKCFVGLHTNHKNLHSNNRIEECGISPGEIIGLLRIGDYFIPVSYAGKTHFIAIRMRESTVFDIKKIVGHAVGTSPETLKCRFVGRLQDRLSLKEYHICEGDCLMSVAEKQWETGTIGVKIHTVKNQAILMEVGANLTVQSLIDEISRQLSTRSYCIRLVCDGVLLNSESYYQIAPCSFVVILFNSDDFLVYVELPSGEQFAVPVLFPGTIATLKSTIHKIKGFSTDRIRLFKDNIPLEDDSLLTENAIADSDKLTASFPSELEIIVESHIDEAFSISTSRQTTVAELKLSLKSHLKTNLPFRVFLRSVQLADERSLGQYELATGSVLTIYREKENCICVRTPLGNSLNVLARQESSVRNVKNAVRRKIGISVKSQELILARELENSFLFRPFLKTQDELHPNLFFSVNSDIA